MKISNNLSSGMYSNVTKSYSFGIIIRDNELVVWKGQTYINKGDKTLLDFEINSVKREEEMFREGGEKEYEETTFVCFLGLLLYEIMP